MKAGKLSRVRNIGFVAHIDAGKTTVSERVLFFTGKIHRMGEVHDGQATMDWMPQEQQRGITITSAVTTCDWNDHEIHIIDTPGHVDFTVEVERSLKVLDGAVMIACAVGGVEAQTETVCLQARKNGVPLLAFVNKLDRMGADFEAVVTQMDQRLELRSLPVQIPWFKDEVFSGVIDLVGRNLIVWDPDGVEYQTLAVPPEMEDDVAAARDHMLEILADFDDAIMEDFLSGDEIAVAKVKAAIRRATISNQVVPVLCGSALKNKGIQPLIDAVIDYLPSPHDVHTVRGHDRDNGAEIEVEIDPDGPLLAYVFKVYMDEGRRLVYLRIYSGGIAVGQEVFNSTRGSSEKIARLFRMHAHHKQRVEKATAGDIIAAVGLKTSVTGDTLAGQDSTLVLEPMDVLKPVISVAIEPRSAEAAERLVPAMRKMMEEDPTIRADEDPDTGQILLAGMGELHIEVALDRFRTTYGVDINVGKPQVLYCSTISGSAAAEVVFEKRIGETDHHGGVSLAVAPRKRGTGNRFVFNDNLDDEIGMNVRAGLEESCLADPVYGHEMVDCEVMVVKVSLQENTTMQGLKIAAQMALHDAFRKAAVAQLEPVMELDVLAPEEHVGDVVGDLSSRRASVEGVTIRGKYHAVKAYIALSQTFGYSTQLRSLTRGRGSFNMRFHGFDKL